MDVRNISDEMIVYRAKHRLSQTDLAKLCGLSTQTVNSVENGIQTPSRLTIEKIKLVIYGGEEKK